MVDIMANLVYGSPFLEYKNTKIRVGNIMNDDCAKWSSYDYLIIKRIIKKLHVAGYICLYHI